MLSRPLSGRTIVCPGPLTRGDDIRTTATTEEHQRLLFIQLLPSEKVKTWVRFPNATGKNPSFLQNTI